jgi:hypothetical protein
MKHRMLRHKALIQAARYAFDFSGITRAARNLILATTGFGRIAEALVGQGLLAPPDEEQNMAKSVAPFSRAIR